MSASALLADPETALWRMTPEAYDALVDSGALEDQRIEMLNGVVVEMSPQGESHVDAVFLVARALDRRLAAAHGERYAVLQQSTMKAVDSRPEPDVAVVSWEDVPRRSRAPRPVHLVVEIAETSQRRDLTHKPAIYAEAGVPLYWVVDLRARRVVVHTEPKGDSYQRVEPRPWSTDLPALGVTIRFSEVLRAI